MSCALVIALTVKAGDGTPVVPVKSGERPRSELIKGFVDLQNQSAAIPGINKATQVAQVLIPASKLVYESYKTGNWEIFRASDDLTYGTNISNNARVDEMPDIKRGGDKVVYATLTLGTYDLFSINLDGSGLKKLTSNTTDDVNPVWSPDGTHIAYENYAPGHPEIYFIDPNGSNPFRYTYSYYSGEPTWSPGGDQLAFTTYVLSLGWRIEVRNWIHSQSHYLSSQDYSENPAWSPDGSMIAYDADPDGDGYQDIYVAQADGSNQRKLNVSPVTKMRILPGWSPDGKYITYTELDGYYSGDQYYWYNSTIRYADVSNPANNWAFTFNSGLDWSADWQTTDTIPPTCSINPLDSVSSYLINIHWEASDSGGAGVNSIQIQTQGWMGDWIDLPTNLNEHNIMYTGTAGTHYYFRCSSTDNAYNFSGWPTSYTASTQVETTPPVSNVLPLPEYTLGATVQVTVQGSDPPEPGYPLSSSGIRYYDIQKMDLANGAWQDWIIHSSETTFTFTGVYGHTYAFRSRATDNAYNTEAWSATADTLTTLYQTVLRGNIYETTGMPVRNADIFTSPDALYSSNQDPSGYYEIYSADSFFHTTWSKAGYSSLPETRIEPLPNEIRDMYMPPADNLIADWGFEQGPLETGPWVITGLVTRITDENLVHTGQGMAQLGDKSATSSSISQVVTIPVTMTHPVLSFLETMNISPVDYEGNFNLSVQENITHTTVYTITPCQSWEQRWFDLSAWSGKTITLTFTLAQVDPEMTVDLDEITLGSAHPDTWVSLSPTQFESQPGTLITYTLTYGNHGAFTTRPISITLSLPPGVDFVRASLTPTLTASLTWAIGDLPPQSNPEPILVVAEIKESAPRLIWLEAIAEIQTGDIELEMLNNQSLTKIRVGWNIFMPILHR